MVQYSFNADLRSVFQRLAAAQRGSQSGKLANLPRRIPLPPAVRQPRIEIAHVALRQKVREVRGSMT